MNVHMYLPSSFQLKQVFQQHHAKAMPYTASVDIARSRV